jgi:murein DD-endopeptidase MepM/ murein hydrolase activator NlpD
LPLSKEVLVFLSVRKRRRYLRFLAALFVFVFVLVVVAVSRSATVPAEHSLAHHRADDVRERAAEARQRESDLGAQIDGQSRAIDGIEGRVDALGSELTALEARLARSRTQLIRIEAAATRTTRQLSFARSQFRLAQQRLGDRLALIYTSGQPELVEILLGASTIDGFVDQLDARQRIVEQDGHLADQLRGLRARLSRQRTRLAALRSRQAAETGRLTDAVGKQRAAYADVIAQRDRLVTLRADRQRTLASVSVDRQQWEAQVDALAGSSSQVAAAASSPAGAAPVPQSQSGGFMWPVRGSVVSPYGQRWGRLHAGIDIAAPAGTAIVASASGRVMYAGTMSGYGLIVVIQHSGNIASAYAHNSRINVSVGQTVGQGQTIAAVGCTGTCYGDHVHFEIRVGGSPVDPMGYL